LIISIAGAVVQRIFWTGFMLEHDSTFKIDGGDSDVALLKVITAFDAASERESISLYGVP